MELVLCLALLHFLKATLATLILRNHAELIPGLLVVSFVELLAIWLLRRQCPGPAVESIGRVRPARQIAAWTTWSIVISAALAIGATMIPGEVSRSRSLLLNAIMPHWTTWVDVILLAPLVEEIVFRAIAIELLRSKLNTTAAIVVAAVLFGLAHFDLFTGVFTFAIGLYFGFCYVRTRSILPGVMGHMAINAIGVAGMLGLFRS